MGKAACNEWDEVHREEIEDGVQDQVKASSSASDSRMK